jgi:hypothetical protein
MADNRQRRGTALDYVQAVTDLNSDYQSADLGKLRTSLARIRAVSGNLLNVNEEVSVDRIRVTGSLARIGDIEVGDLLALAADGHTIEATAQSGSWNLTVRAEGPHRPLVEMNGPPEQALPASTVDPLRRAYERGDAVAALELSNEVGGSISVTLRNDPSITGVHWLSSMQDLEPLLNGPGWAATARQLVDGTSSVVIDDMRNMHMTTRTATFAGPDADWRVPQEDQLDTGYRTARIAEGWTQLPSPFAFQPRSSDGAHSDEEREMLRRLERSLQGTAMRLVWFWLATEARLEPEGVLTITFSGARVITLSVFSGPVESATSEVDLYEWASSGTDPARRESLQQAVSLALVTPSDLATAAKPALRTARLLYDLSQRGAVAEALAARRAARAAAAESARGAAQAARYAAGKAVERALLQAAAAVGIVLSDASDLIGRAPALVLLGLVAVVAVGSVLIALRVELPSAREGLTAELADLGEYRDVLSGDEIADIANAQSVKSASLDLGRARRTIVIVYAIVVITTLALGGPYVLSHHADSVTPRPMTPTPTVRISTLP